MDYPFFIKQIAYIKPDDVQSLDNQPHSSSPYFKDNLTKGVTQIATHELGNRFIRDKVWPTISSTFHSLSSVKWYEINTINPGGVIKEHADLESRSFDTNEGLMTDPYKALEVVLCHKIHIPLQGDSRLSFRRSRHDQHTDFRPEVGGVYLFNNYVLHKSVCLGDVARMAMTIVVKDEGWQAKRAILNRFNYPHSNAYDGLRVDKKL